MCIVNFKILKIFFSSIFSAKIGRIVIYYMYAIDPRKNRPI